MGADGEAAAHPIVVARTRCCCGKNAAKRRRPAAKPPHTRSLLNAQGVAVEKTPRSGVGRRRSRRTRDRCCMPEVLMYAGEAGGVQKNAAKRRRTAAKMPHTLSLFNARGVAVR